MKTDNYKSVIDAICSSEVVLSSSLHGLILAESYGVPAVFFQDRPDRFNFKYEDWYRSTGREFQVCHSLEEARYANPIELPELDGLRKGLLDSFPYDLWGEKE